MNDFLQPFVTIISILLAIVAWIAKIRWSKEYQQTMDVRMKAKDEQLHAKDEEIKRMDSLKEERLKAEQDRVSFYKDQLAIFEKKTPDEAIGHLNKRNSELENENAGLRERIAELEIKIQQLPDARQQESDSEKTTWQQLFSHLEELKKEKNNSISMKLFIFICSLYKKLFFGKIIAERFN